MRARSDRMRRRIGVGVKRRRRTAWCSWCACVTRWRDGGDLGFGERRGGILYPVAHVGFCGGALAWVPDWAAWPRTLMGLLGQP
jgi:hypothetical protein